MVDHSTMQMLLAAQNAGSGQAGIYSLIAPAAVAGMFFIGVIILIGIIGGILDHFTEKPDQIFPIWEEFPKDDRFTKKEGKTNEQKWFNCRTTKNRR